MSDLHAERVVAPPASASFAVFDRPVHDWLPVIVGPDEGTWRIVTREGPSRVQLVATIGDVWILADGTHARRVVLRPDATSWRNLLTAGLTPTVEGHLTLVASNGTTVLAFDGRTRRRSWQTGPLERLLVGDPLTRSGLDSLLDMIEDRLAADPPAGDGGAAAPTGG